MPLSGIGRFGAKEVSGDTLVGAAMKTVWSFRLRITLYGEHAFRVLVYLAERNGKRCTVRDIAAAYGVSANHLTRVVAHLARSGFITTYRGKGGGLELGRAPASINLGAVFRAVERDLAAGDFDPLAPIAREALDAYLAVLDRYTLEDVLRERRPPSA